MIRKLLHKGHGDEDAAAHAPAAHATSHAAAGHDDESNWLVSYADMMTLLCGFFIMLFSMSRLDEPKFEKMKEAIAKEFGGEYEPKSKKLADFATKIVQDNGLQDQTKIELTPGGIAVTFQSTVFFETLSAEVSDPGKVVLDKLMTDLSQLQTNVGREYKIIVEGHTDGRPVVGGDYPSNWELSSARASRVVRLFLDRQFRPDHLAAIGYADTRPQAPHRAPSGAFDESALIQNRRVVLRILEPEVDAIPLPEAPKAPGPATEPAETTAPAASASG